jgi:hypothetical protein
MKAPTTMAELAQHRQERYEHRRRARILGMAIDQTIQGLKNIAVYSNPKFWEVDDEGLMDVQKWKSIQSDAEIILNDTIRLEEKLRTMADIYASMMPTNKELDMYRDYTITDKD